MKKRFLPALLFLLSFLWIVFIFSNSLENSVESGEKSTWVYNLIHAFLPWVSKLFIRKMGHFAEFAILGVLLSFSINSLLSPAPVSSLKSRLPLFFALPAIFTVGCLDELLQNFSEGRHPAFTDVLIDTAGGLFGVLFIFGLLLIILHARKKL